MYLIKAKNGQQYIIDTTGIGDAYLRLKASLGLRELNLADYEVSNCKELNATIHRENIGHIGVWEVPTKQRTSPLNPAVFHRGLDIPKNKNYTTDAAQCDDCGGNGCTTCNDNGWLPAGHLKTRRCYNTNCNKPLPPEHVAVYCTNKCAQDDT